MPLVRAKTLYQQARAGGYAVGGFDAEHIDMVKAIVEAAEETQSPAIIFIWQEDIKSVGPGLLEAVARQVAGQSRVPLAIMCDHASDLQMCLTCILHGHSGVMIDASHLPFEDNIRETRRIVEICHLLDVLVEGELGTVKRGFEETGPFAREAVLTPPEAVAEYVSRSGVDALAVSIGNESGVYKERPQLDFPRLRAIRQRTDAYLILHGGSGIPEEQVRQAVQDGIAGIRYATEMRLAYFDALENARRQLARDNPDSRLIMGPARQAAKELMKKRMEQLGSAGRAACNGRCAGCDGRCQQQGQRAGEKVSPQATGKQVPALMNNDEIERLVALIAREVQRRA
ncbi:MAG: class II fructose-bisphosphate aldolase family protein [Anaerolineae bacterium]|nr:class II fructose-bisphosphate aldolase family protein [Anaerolineae bacterium]